MSGVVTVSLWDSLGTTFIADIPDAIVTWQEELSKPGTATVTMPVTHPPELGVRSILKFAIDGVTRFGCRVVSTKAQSALDNLTNNVVTIESQPGLLSMLSDAVVLPEYGVNRVSGSERIFGFMSKQGYGWYQPSDWSTPVAYPMSTDTLRTGYPPALKSANPSWIGAVSPATSQPVPTDWYFRREFTVSAAQNVSIEFTADNFLTLYLDGQQITTPDTANNHAYRDVFAVPTWLSAGSHILAAQVTNANGGASNPMGLIGCVYTLNSVGSKTGTLIETDTNWKVNNGSPSAPGWHRGQVLLALCSEAAARGVLGAGVNRGFTATHDSAGQPWGDIPDEYSFPIYTTSLADIAAQLGEVDIDISFNAATMTLDAWNRKGVDRSATVALTHGKSGGSLTSYETANTSARFTVVGTQLANGSWREVQDSVGVSTWGRIEMGLTNANSEQSSVNAARAQLAETVQLLLSITAATSSLVGPQPYTSYALGDTIMVPGHGGGGTLKARAIAISVDATTVPIRSWPELVQDAGDTNGGIPPRRLPPSGAQRVITKLATIANKVTSNPGGGSNGSAVGVGGNNYGSSPPAFAVVQHGADGSVARPDAVVVYWIGAAIPANAQPYDFHYTATI